jgi:hypothetical protein
MFVAGTLMQRHIRKQLAALFEPRFRLCLLAGDIARCQASPPSKAQGRPTQGAAIKDVRSGGGWLFRSIATSPRPVAIAGVPGDAGYAPRDKSGPESESCQSAPVFWNGSWIVPFTVGLVSP